MCNGTERQKRTLNNNNKKHTQRVEEKKRTLFLLCCALLSIAVAGLVYQMRARDRTLAKQFTILVGRLGIITIECMQLDDGDDERRPQIEF